jgi:hypothetical protein
VVEAEAGLPVLEGPGCEEAAAVANIWGCCMGTPARWRRWTGTLPVPEGPALEVVPAVAKRWGRTGKRGLVLAEPELGLAPARPIPEGIDDGPPPRCGVVTAGEA